MVSVVQNVAIDCADAYEPARFWSRATGSPLHPEDEPGEARKAKNRIHLCLRPEASRDQEVERLLGLGATLVTDLRNPDGTGWAVPADPEGNEFCVLRSESDRAATSSGNRP